MRKTLTFAAAAVLAGISFSASAWYWGAPYAYPYAGLYAPAYGYTISQDQLNAIAERQKQMAEQWAKSGYGPWGAGPFAPWGQDPFVSEPGDFTDNPFMSPAARRMFEQSDADREQALKDSAARREAARARAEAQRAAMQTRRQAWRDSVSAYSPYAQAPFSGARSTAPASAAPAAEPEVQAAPAAE